MAPKKPFHKTIVDLINPYEDPAISPSVMIGVIFPLLRNTTIPEGHDEIITAIKRYFDLPALRFGIPPPLRSVVI